ncbi:MAG: NAD(+) diphosphatase [Eubacteriales bacterium]|nr:NAD(+) diphosphatase [Eubacteriales bacterium]
MIQDIAPHKLINQYDPSAVPQPEDYVLCFDSGRVLLKTVETLQLLRVLDFPENCQFVYLFTVDDARFFLLAGETAAPDGCEYVDARTLRGSKLFPKEILFAILTGKHLADWYRDTRFCGRCGKPMTHSLKERAMKCACGYTAYPRIMPAVIVGVKNGDSILLTKYRTGFAYNALIAGFTEIGETAEETVAREVMEEAGIRVKNITYYKTQPWGIANDLLLGFYCDVDGDPGITMDANELKYAAWVKREDIELQPDDFSLTNEMMMMFKTGKIR